MESTILQSLIQAYIREKTETRELYVSERERIQKRLFRILNNKEQVSEKDMDAIRIKLVLLTGFVEERFLVIPKNSGLEWCRDVYKLARGKMKSEGVESTEEDAIVLRRKLESFANTVNSMIRLWRKERDKALASHADNRRVIIETLLNPELDDLDCVGYLLLKDEEEYTR